MFKKNDQKTTFRKITRNFLNQPEILITPNALYKMKKYVDKFNVEVAWLALVERVDRFKFIIYDTVFLQQEITSVTAEIDEEALAEYGNKLISEGKYEEFDRIKCWGHSHVNMGVFASTQDEETFVDFYSNCDYFIRIICNKKDEMKLDIVLVNEELRWDNCSFTVLLNEEDNALNQQIEELEQQKQLLEQQLENSLKAIKETSEGIVDDEIKSTLVTQPVTQVGIHPGSYVTGFGNSRYTEDLKKNIKMESETEEEIEIGGKDEFGYRYYVSVYNGTYLEDYVSIDTIFSDETMLRFYSSGYSSCDLERIFSDNVKFESYTDNDWEDLKETMYNYCEEVIGNAE